MNQNAKHARDRATFSLRFGMLCEPLAKQLKDQGFVLEHSEHWERRAKAISELRVLGLLTGSEAHKAEKRFMARIRIDVRIAHRIKPHKRATK